METAATVNKRRSLTLSSRLLQKRHSASPQSRVRASAAQDVAAKDSSDLPIVENVESTPPNKKLHSLDDSLDFSPQHHSLSPSCLFSQTVVTGSPEVGWRWNSDNSGRGDKVNTTSDSGFDSEELGLGLGLRGAAKQKQRHKQVRADDLMNRRKLLENKQWRAQQIRDHQLLKERCDKLHKQLDQQTAKPTTAPTAEAPAKATEPQTAVAPVPTVAADAALNDFLNDSDTDCFLLEASQQLESKQEVLETLKEPPVVTTPTSHHKKYNEKRSSFYMKFLEDESESEDWFVALDEAMLEASQPKKPRTSLLRYKSMPNNTAGEVSNGVSNPLATNTASSSSTTATIAGIGKSETPRIKRHASSHALSPAASCVRGNLFGRRK